MLEKPFVLPKDVLVITCQYSFETKPILGFIQRIP